MRPNWYLVIGATAGSVVAVALLRYFAATIPSGRAATFVNDRWVAIVTLGAAGLLMFGTLVRRR